MIRCPLKDIVRPNMHGGPEEMVILDDQVCPTSLAQVKQTGRSAKRAAFVLVSQWSIELKWQSFLSYSVSALLSLFF